MSAPRYRLRADAFFVKTDDGVWVRNNRGSFSIKGASAYQLVKRLFVCFQEGATVEEVCAGLGGGVRAAVEDVVGRFHEHGFVRPMAEPPETVPAWARALYDDQLRFLEHQALGAFARFLRFRQTRWSCIGHGPLMRAVLTALAESGAARVSFETDEDLAALALAATRRDPELVFEAGPASADAIVLAGAPEELLGRTGVAAIFARGEDLVVSSPLPADGPVCLECLARAFPAEGPAAEVRPIAAALAAHQLVHDLFCQRAGVAVDESPVARTVDGRSLAIKVHRLHAHPRCSRHGGRGPGAIVQPDGGLVRPDLPGALDPPELVQEQDRITSAVGGWCGLAGPLLRVGEGELPQVPLASSECAVQGHAVVCTALSAREARNQAVLLALESLGRSLLGRDDLGAGWSASEAAYRAAVRLALAEPLERRESGGGGESREGQYLLALLADHGAGPLRWRTARSSLGWHVAEVASSAEVGRGAGPSPLNAELNALLDLATRVAGGQRPALLSAGLTTWSLPRGLRVRDASAALPFAAGELHLVAVERE